MKKIFVFSHVDRDWIKQRPQFLAEALRAAGYDVIFGYARAYSRRSLTRQALSVRTIPLIGVPQRRRSRWHRLDHAVQWLVGTAAALSRPEVVWVSSPRFAESALRLKSLTGARLVYDCMDRIGEFESAASSDSVDERLLVEGADLITCSSALLAEDVKKQLGSARTIVVRNALSEPSRWVPKSTGIDSDPARDAGSNPSGQRLRLGYSGTISSWFDWDLILRVLDRKSNWELRLWGPSDVTIPPHPRVIHGGVVPHADLPAQLASCDVLVMPFQVTPLIEAVDPVKAYEYVATGQPVVLPKYGESIHFAPLARLYRESDAISFVACVEDAMARPNPWQLVREFAESNTWDVRARLVDRALDGLP